MLLWALAGPAGSVVPPAAGHVFVFAATSLQCRGVPHKLPAMLKVRPVVGHAIHSRFWYRWYIPAA